MKNSARHTRCLLFKLSSILTALLLIPSILLGLQYSSNTATTTSLNTVLRREYSNSFLAAEEQWARDIKCYALPYGVVGFVSHLWTYWTIVCLLYYRKPWFPFSEISRSPVDVVLAVVQGSGTAILSGLNIARCNFSWQLVCISAWKMTFSLGLTFTTISAWATKGNAATLAEALGGVSRLVILFYIASCVAGFAGLALMEGQVGYIPGVLIANGNGSATGAKCEIITLAFMSFASVAAILYGCWRMPDERGKSWGRSDFHEAGIRTWTAFVWYFLPAIGVVFALYSDWILGVIARDVMGLPSAHKVLYWVYFALKRLPFFTS